MKTFADMHVAVLMGGPGSERAVSLASGEGVRAAVVELGCRVTPVVTEGENFTLPAEIDIVFNIIHGTFGEDGRVQRILTGMGVPFTGEGVAESELAFDKILCKEKFLEASVPTAAFEVIRPGEAPTMPFPIVIKAPREGSSVGIHIVKDPGALGPALADVANRSDRILVEEFVAGRELTVGILGEDALPVVEIIPEGGFYNFQNKYPFLHPGGGASHHCPAQLDKTVTALVQRVALDARNALGLCVYSRVDILLAAEGPSVLEINTIPGMTPASLLPEAAAAEGISFSDLCGRIIRLSLQRRDAR